MPASLKPTVNPPWTPTRSQWGLVALGALALALYFLAAYAHAYFITPDGQNYWEGAASLLQGHGYRILDGTPIIGYPPAFPLWLSLWMRLPLAQSTAIWCALLASALVMATLSAFALARLCRDTWVPMLIALPMITNTIAFMGGQLLSESLFYPLVFAAYLLYLHDLQDGSDSRLAVAALLSVAIIVRNIGVGYAAGFFLAYLLAVDGARVRAKSLLIPVLPALLLFIDGAVFHQFQAHPVDVLPIRVVLSGLLDASSDVSTMGVRAAVPLLPVSARVALALLFLGSAVHFLGARALAPLLLSVAGVFATWCLTPVDPFLLRFSLPLVWTGIVGAAVGLYRLCGRRRVAAWSALPPALFAAYTALLIGGRIEHLPRNNVTLGKDMCPFAEETRSPSCFRRQFHVPPVASSAREPTALSGP